MISVRSLSEHDFSIIKARLLRGEEVQVIALDYNINMGRISEIKNGHRAAHIQPANLRN